MTEPSKPASARELRPFSGYHNRPVPNDDSFITQVGPGTPGGEYLRRYWHPFLLASELKDLPVPVRLLGEDLVVFRDGSGQLGLLHRHCIHRGTSLEYGIVAERGIRCCYHGWHFDVDGTVLDTPAEPPTSCIKSNFVQGAYRIHEWKGLLFAYMGPVDAEPEFPTYGCVDNPDDNEVVPFRMNLPCNWVQIVENGSDPIHNAYLHAIVAGQQFSPAFKVLPQLDFPETPLGFLSMATRLVNGRVFVRASDIIMPNIGQFTGSSNKAAEDSFRIGCGRTRWVTPIDDVNCHYIGYVHFSPKYKPYGNLTPEDLGVDKAGLIGQTDERPYKDRQREPGDYDAVASQGQVANRRTEHLGTTDRGVVMFRRLLAKAIQANLQGETPVLPQPMLWNGKTRTFAHEYVLSVGSEAAGASHDALQAFGRAAAQAVVAAQSMQMGNDDIEQQTHQKVLQLLKELVK